MIVFEKTTWFDLASTLRAKSFEDMINTILASGTNRIASSREN